jgi:hypothetical protein
VKYRLVIVFIIAASFSSAAQETPEAFSKAFIDCFLNYKEDCAKMYMTLDTTARKPILAELGELYKDEVKPNLRGRSLSSSTRAVLKDNHTSGKEFADIFITITADNKDKYELSLWGCYSIDGKWYLGEKIEMKKL